MSQVMTKPRITLDSLLRNETFQEGRARRISSREEKLRECRDLYLKAHFATLISRMYQYRMLEGIADEEEFHGETDELWKWFLAAVNGLRYVEELTPELREQIQNEFVQPVGGIFAILDDLSVLEREKVLLSYFKAALKLASGKGNNQEFLHQIEANISREIGKLVHQVHSEQELRIFTKLVETYLLGLQVACLNKKLDKSLYWSFCRRFPLLRTKLSLTVPPRHDGANTLASTTFEESILLQLEPTTHTAATPTKTLQPTATTPLPPSSTVSHTHLDANPSAPTSSQNNKKFLSQSSSFYSTSHFLHLSILKYLPSWMTDFRDARFIAVVVMILIAVRRARWFKTLLRYGLITVRDLIDVLTTV